MAERDGTGIALVVGASGGLGAAFVDRLAGDPRFAAVHALSRRPTRVPAGVATGRLDLEDEGSIAAAAAGLGDAPVTLLVVATGLLHDGDLRPEKSWRQLDADRLARSFRVNAIGPALVLKHMLPRLARDRPAVAGVLSARVGSISDNRLGGWYGYRAAKAALNQIVRTAAIELARTHPLAACVALHPGTVATGLSEPFRGGVAPERLFTPADAAGRLLAVLAAIGPERTGELVAFDGRTVPP